MMTEGKWNETRWKREKIGRKSWRGGGAGLKKSVLYSREKVGERGQHPPSIFTITFSWH